MHGGSEADRYVAIVATSGEVRQQQLSIRPSTFVMA
jgi:hypothetical protein